MIFGFQIVDSAKSYLIIPLLYKRNFSIIFASLSLKGRSRGLSIMFVRFLIVNLAQGYCDIPKFSNLVFLSFMHPVVSRVNLEVSAP